MQVLSPSYQQRIFSVNASFEVHIERKKHKNNSLGVGHSIIKF